MSTLLSTKKLTSAQENSIFGAGFSLVSYDAIAIEFIDFEINKHIANSIFTSQNAVRAVLQHSLVPKLTLGNCFCVGEKTSSLLLKNGYKIRETAETASKLADIIVKNYQTESFVFFTGDRRRDELPAQLEKFNISFKETITYRTTLKPHAFHQNFDGVLFFSPSGVESYFQRNNLVEGVAFCIGPTTAEAAKKYTNSIEIAPVSTMERVIECALHYLKPTV